MRTPLDRRPCRPRYEVVFERAIARAQEERDRMRQREAGHLLRTEAEPSEAISDMISDILAADVARSNEKPAKLRRTFHETAVYLLSNP